MSKAKDFKEAFRKLDQYNNGEISESEFNLRAIIGSRCPPMTMSEVDNVIGELGTDGEDRVFGASKFLVGHRHLSQALINEQLKKESGVFNPDGNRKKTENQLQVSKKHLEDKISKEMEEDWVVIENSDFEFS